MAELNLHSSAPSIDAVLVMESRGSSSLRHIVAHQGSSKLYQAGPFYLDIQVKALGEDYKIEGQLLTQTGQDLEGEVSLLDLNEDELSHTSVMQGGSFTVKVAAARAYRLIINLDKQRVKVNRLELA